MAYRTTEQAVAAIVETTPTISLTPFLRMANTLTDWLSSVDDEGLLSTSLKAEIELNLAAHFYSMRDQQFQSKSTGGASGSFKGQSGLILHSTQYGQMAMLLDVTNKLARRSKEAETGQRNMATMTWLGTDYDDVPESYLDTATQDVGG